MNVDAYLRRIGYAGSREMNAATLRALHRAHMLAVPFENLDVGRTPIAIGVDAILRKIVDRRRGGFCYELNGAFSELLRALGFRVVLLSASVARDSGGFGPEFDHLALLVTIGEERWLADVGFGDSFVEPLPFVTGIEHRDPAGIFRIDMEDRQSCLSPGDDRGYVLQRWDAAAIPQYRFSLTPRELHEFSGMCDYHQTSPKSSFTQKKVCSRATEDGRITLSGDKLIVTSKDNRSERSVSEAEWTGLLRTEFEIAL